MLGEHCETCNCPLMKDKKLGKSICVQCQMKLAQAIVSGSKLEESAGGQYKIEI